MARCELPLKIDSNGGQKSFTSTRETMLKQLNSSLKKKRRRTFMAFLQQCRFNLVQEVFHDYGAMFVNQRREWTIAWIDFPILFRFYSKLKPYQRINHFPGMSEICKKNLLAQNLKKMMDVLPQSYDFFPLTFCLPDEERDLLKYCRKRPDVFILKPDLTSQGVGIELVKGVPNTRRFLDVVCQKYISPPLLMDGFKFDLRLYVLVTSIFPLRVFIYTEGLVRLATIPYRKPKPENMKEKRMHLTNYAINRPTRNDSKERENEICKKSFTDFDKLLLSKGVSPKIVWGKIDDLIVKTIISAQPHLEHMFHMAFPMGPAISPCFELLGFDVLLDKTCKPYLLEVNKSPSLGGSSTFDSLLKRDMVKNVLDMVLLTPKQIAYIKDEEHTKSITRLTNKTLIRSLTPREQILFEHQEIYEMERAGKFRKLYPTLDGKYDEAFAETYRLEGREKLITKTTAPFQNVLGGREEPERTVSEELIV